MWGTAASATAKLTRACLLPSFCQVAAEQVVAAATGGDLPMLLRLLEEDPSLLQCTGQVR